MRIKEIRRQRLQQLIDEEYEGTQARLVEALELNASHISQIMTTGRGIGETFARKIELRAGKPRGWLDGIDDPLALLEPKERRLVERYRRTDDRGRQAIDHTAENQAEYADPD